MGIYFQLNIKKYKLLLFCVLLMSSLGFGQVQENMLMERFFMNAFNPAYTGIEGKSFAAITRKTMTGVQDAPRTNYLYYAGNRKKNLSLGLSFVTNKIFIDTRNQYSIDGSYLLNLGGAYKLSLGIKAGLGSKNTDIDALDRITVENNPFISSTTQGNYPIFGAGFLLYSENFYFSLGTPNLLNPQKFIDDTAFIQNQNPIVYLLTGTKLNWDLFGTTINPYFSSKLIPNTLNQYSLGANIEYKSIFEIGAGYKNTEQLYVMAMLKLKSGLQIAYGSDFGLVDGNSSARSGFELLVKYIFDK